MAETFRQLGHLFVQSIPTVIFVFLLAAILDRLFFRPLTAVLKQREEETLGALDRARALSAAAEAKVKEYEAAFQAARQEVYRLRESDRRAALQEREEILKAERARSESTLRDAQAALQAEVESVKQQLASTTHALALAVTHAVLGEATPVGPEGGGGQ
jgi:F0F1-type ATP synthase membrane subunit b/b'